MEATCFHHPEGINILYLRHQNFLIEFSFGYKRREASLIEPNRYPIGINNSVQLNLVDENAVGDDVEAYPLLPGPSHFQRSLAAYAYVCERVITAIYREAGLPVSQKTVIFRPPILLKLLPMNREPD